MRNINVNINVNVNVNCKIIVMHVSYATQQNNVEDLFSQQNTLYSKMECDVNGNINGQTCMFNNTQNP